MIKCDNSNLMHTYTYPNTVHTHVHIHTYTYNSYMHIHIHTYIHSYISAYRYVIAMQNLIMTAEHYALTITFCYITNAHAKNLTTQFNECVHTTGWVAIAMCNQIISECFDISWSFLFCIYYSYKISIGQEISQGVKYFLVI